MKEKVLVSTIGLNSKQIALTVKNLIDSGVSQIIFDKDLKDLYVYRELLSNEFGGEDKEIMKTILNKTITNYKSKQPSFLDLCSIFDNRGLSITHILCSSKSSLSNWVGDTTIQYRDFLVGVPIREVLDLDQDVAFFIGNKNKFNIPSEAELIIKVDLA